MNGANALSLNIFAVGIDLTINRINYVQAMELVSW